jgi:hypothetical protein
MLQEHASKQLRRTSMKSENKIPATKKPRNSQSTEVKAAVPAWTPQPNLLTREEIRKLVIDQIG